VLPFLQGDIFSGLNDGLLSRAEALAAVDMQKHQSSHAAHQQMTQQLKVNKLDIKLVLENKNVVVVVSARCHVISSWNVCTTKANSGTHTMKSVENP